MKPSSSSLGLDREREREIGRTDRKAGRENGMGKRAMEKS